MAAAGKRVAPPPAVNQGGRPDAVGNQGVQNRQRPLPRPIGDRLAPGEAPVQPIDPRYKSRVCYNCGEPGHYIGNCIRSGKDLFHVQHPWTSHEQLSSVV
jgi:hypothetical protein